MSEEMIEKKSAAVFGCRQVRHRLLKTKEAAEYLGVSKWKVRQLAQDGALPYVAETDGSPWRFDLCDLEQYIERNRQLIS